MVHDTNLKHHYKSLITTSSVSCYSSYTGILPIDCANSKVLHVYEIAADVSIPITSYNQNLNQAANCLVHSLAV